MPLRIFGTSSESISSNIYTSSCVQKPCIRTSYIQSNIEEDIDMKNQFKNRNLKTLSSHNETLSKSYVNIKFNDPSIKTNSEHFDFNDKSVIAVRFVKVNSYQRAFDTENLC